jgi:membrane protease YdiL (CAAX protease family)
MQNSRYESKDNQKLKIFDYLLLPPDSNMVPFVYVQLLALAEILTTLRAHFLGLALHGIILCVLLVHGALEGNLRYRRFYLSLSLAPLMRVLSLSLPLSGRPLVEWFFWIGLLVFVGIFFTMRITEISASRIGIKVGKLPIQLLFGLVGIPLGIIEYYILRPEPLTPEFNLEAMILPAVVLIIFTGVLEEVLFRGLIQQIGITAYSRFGITFSAVLFAVLHVGYGSFADVVFVFVVAMIFGLITHHTGSLLGVSIAHGLTNIGLLLVFPHLIGDNSFLQIIEIVKSLF